MKTAAVKTKPIAKAKSAAKTKIALLTHPEKVFWPDDGYTKQDLADHYRRVFPRLKQYVDDRVLTLERCPNGMEGQCFYQKEKPKGLPTGTPSKRISRADGGATNYVVGGSLETQLALVNLGCIPIHVFGSRASAFPKPDWMCIDIDPASGKFSDAADASRHVKDALDKLNLISYVKTSGSRGIHVFVPLRIGPTADEILKFAESFVQKLAAAHPKQLTVEHSIAARGQRVYLDPFRNGSVQTVVTPYSVRRRPHAPVSTPLDWNEVKPNLDPATFNIGNFDSRLTEPDPWGDFFSKRQSLTAARKKM
jgi:bifunctional non-homologous end joining protein LigD